MIGSRPYQNTAIVDILRDFFFGLHGSVTAVMRNRFDPAEEHLNRFPPSTIALVATAVCSSTVVFSGSTNHVQVCAGIEEWHNGWRQPVNFSSNIFMDIYNNHLVLLKSIQEQNENAYCHLL